MKNKQYLEQIIRGYLTEASVNVIAKAIIAPEKIRSAAKKVGAEEAFIAKLAVRGKHMPSEEQIYDNLVNAVSMHSQIGKNSKFANGSYVYVLSKDMRDAEKNFLYTGFIFSKEKFNQLTTPATTEKPDVTLTATAKYHVGQSKLVTNTVLDQLSVNTNTSKVVDVLNATNKSAETASPTIDVTTNEPTTPVNTSAAKFAAGDIIPFNGAVIDTYAFKNGQFVQTNFPHTSNKNETGEFVKAVTDEKTGQVYGFIKMKSSSSSDGFNHWYVKIEDLNALIDSNSTNASGKFTYPYDMGNGHTAYTMSETDPWIYSVDNGAWWTMKKAPYEEAVKNGTSLPKAIRLSNAAAINKLNAKFPDAGGDSVSTSSDMSTDAAIVPDNVDTTELQADVKADIKAAESVPGVVKGKLKNKFTLSIKSNPSGTAIQNFDLNPGSDLIFNPNTKTWLIYPKPERAKMYGWHAFKYVMGSNVFKFAGRAPGHDRATWISSALAKYLNSESYVNSLKSVYTTKDPALQEDLNKCLAIAKDLRLVSTVNPNKYFWRFRSATDDNEEAAANYFKVAFNKAWGADLKRLRGVENEIATNSVKISETATELYNAIKSGRSYNKTLSIVNPENKKVTDFNINWSYM